MEFEDDLLRLKCSMSNMVRPNFSRSGRAEARREVLSWLAFLYTVGFGIFWVYMWVSMTGQVPTHGAPINAQSFQLMGAVMGVIVIAVFAVPLWIMIRYLRGAEVRAAIASAHRPNA